MTTKKYFEFKPNVKSYTTETGLQSFAHPRVCRCCRGFRFHASGFHYSLPTNRHISKETPTMHFAFYTHIATHFVFRLCAVHFLCGVNSLVSFTNKMVEQLLQVTSEYKEQLRRCEYIPRFSFGRRMLRDDGDPNRLFLMYLFCEQSHAIQFLKDIGLLRSKMQCNTSGRDMTWSADSTHSEGFRWWFSKEGCWGQV
jgi:hypothetical protein